MIESIAFQTRARTIDHLGREQIADAPIAVSELWKNAYDAYARNVGLHIYSGNPAIATIVDDGHGMNREEFTNRWLVIGTESKAGNISTPEEDRNGLPIRTKQGQKGIGRLSSANLGSLLLVVSKRKNHPFIASLIDWRLFENPYLFLMDIQVPLVEFDHKDELLPLLPTLFEQLLCNLGTEVSNVKQSERDKRISYAWQTFDALEQIEEKEFTTRSLIKKTVIDTVFEEKHFSEWPLWKNEKDCGTVLAISNIQFDLESQLPDYNGDEEHDSTITQARLRLFQTLSNFTAPFFNEEEKVNTLGFSEFKSTVTARNNKQLKIIVEDTLPFDLNWLYELEHVLEGNFDREGHFKGRIKLFGKWLDQEILIPPAINLPIRKDSLLGPFSLRIGGYEGLQNNSGHSSEAWQKIDAQAKLYSGLLIFRNGLRVMPYGREGSDFFEIEERRAKNAGKYFWALRRLFGHVALTRELNPNLKDKAGREGLIDNKSAKTFRDLVANVLVFTADNYFGSASATRKPVIDDRKNAYSKQQAEDAKNRQRAKNRKEFSARLTKCEPAILLLLERIENLHANIENSLLQDESEVINFREQLSEIKRQLKELVINDPPRNLGTLEERYVAYKKIHRQIKEIADLIDDSLNLAIEKIKPKSARDIAYSELSANAAFLHRRIRSWASEAKSLLLSEQERLNILLEERNKAYHAIMLPLIDDVAEGRKNLREAILKLEEERDFQDIENASLFESYVFVLSSLKERIDLASLARYNQDIADDLRDEVDRLHALAQLGITVEIIGHEIEGLERSISTNLKNFPETIRNSIEYTTVRDSHEALVDRLRFLSPLKLSGPKTRVQISGQMIFDYVQRFFHDNLEAQDIKFEPSSAFLNFSVYDQPARIYPVFVNLVNNAAYWVTHTKEQVKHILLDAVGGRVIIADNGPGVDIEDRKRLFQLFFTRKIRGGRGVGLYLCRTNLAAGGHTIEYADEQQTLLSGANFVINFRGAKYE